MGMLVTVETIVEAGALLAAVLAIAAFIYKIIKWVQKQEQQSVDIEALNAEMLVISTAMLACLDGLKQLGADGNVTKAFTDLQSHLNERAHKQK